MLNPHKDAGTDVESYCGMYQIGVVVVGGRGGGRWYVVESTHHYYHPQWPRGLVMLKAARLKKGANGSPGDAVQSNLVSEA